MEIELLFVDELFRGLGRVAAEGVSLRGNQRPAFAEIRSPEGVEGFDFVLTDQREQDGGHDLSFSMKTRATGLQDWMTHAVRNLRVTGDWASVGSANAILQLSLRPISDGYGGREFIGFSYQYEFRSEDIAIYRILDRSSWAVGGSISGNTFWHRSEFAPSVMKFETAERAYSTEWYLPSAPNPNIFQFRPFQTDMESFTMTTSPSGVLLTIAPQLAHIRSLFEKPEGVEELLHWHEHCGDLAMQFKTTPLQILFSGGQLDHVDAVNLYEEVKQRVSDGLHNQARIRRERITTYAVLEEWGLPDFRKYTDAILPQLLATGAECVFLPSQFVNNMNTHGVGNMCCVLDYKVAASVGEEKVRAFCDNARAGGVRVQMWGNTALSTLRTLLRKPGTSDALLDLKEPFLRNPSHAVEADHYAPAFSVLNLRNEDVRAYWHRHWKDAGERLGIGGIFLDSSFNISSDKFHFLYHPDHEEIGATADQTSLLGHLRPKLEPPRRITSQYFAHLELIAEMQEYGFQYCGEDIGVFGTHRHAPGLDARLGNLFLWGECLCVFDRAAIEAAGFAEDAVFFQGLAYRMMWMLYWNFDRASISLRISGGTAADDPTEWQLALLHAFNRVNDRMLVRRVLPGEVGVAYESEQGIVLWVFEDFPFDSGEEIEVHEILSDETFVSTRFFAKKHRVYEITPLA